MIDYRSLDSIVASYSSSTESNDDVWVRFTERLDIIPFLKEHRDWVEANSWGFGDRAFHYMWYLLLTEDIYKREHPSLLEIGVYKGQVISLWALIAKHLGVKPSISAITPLAGTQRPLPNVLHKVALRLSARYREHAAAGNQYQRDDYAKAVRTIHQQFGLDIRALELLHGFSEDAVVKGQVADHLFDLVYIDGGHRYEEVRHDINFYGERVKPGGYLVLDDASYHEPGTCFWKGHESVSDAVRDAITPSRWTNILNVGHNRIFRRMI